MKKRLIIFFALLSALAVTIGGMSAFAILGADNGAAIRGDVNGDGKINVNDCVCIMMIESGSASDTGRADIDCDGNVTALDAEILSEYIAGIRETLPGSKTETERI